MKKSIIPAAALLLSASLVNTTHAQQLHAADDPAIFTTVKAFLHQLNSGGGKPIEQLSPVAAREVLSGLQQSVKVDYSGIEESEKTISQDGQSIKIHIVKPKGTKGELPVFMFFHGGGWVLGDYPTHRRLVRDLVVESGVAAVFPDYTPSPEAQYPVAINQAYAATKWVALHGKEIGLNGNRLVVAGNSVGGNMAAVVALMAKEKGAPAIRQQVLLWPVTAASFETGSYKSFAEERFLSRNMMIWFWDNYTKDLQQRKEIYAAPLNATVAQLAGLPPALVQTAENDVLRDEGEAYARKMEEAGVPVTLTRYQGLIHDFGLLNPIANIPAVKTAITQAAVVIRNAVK